MSVKQFCCFVTITDKKWDEPEKTHKAEHSASFVRQLHDDLAHQFATHQFGYSLPATT
jgi:hypothetical protein